MKTLEECLNGDSRVIYCQQDVVQTFSPFEPSTELFGELVGNHDVFYSIYVKVLAELVSMDRHTPDRSVRT